MSVCMCARTTANGRGLYKCALAIPPGDFEWYATASGTVKQPELVFPAGWADANETVTVVVV